MADRSSREAGIAVALRFRSRRALLVFLRQHEFRLRQRRPLFGNPTSTLDWRGLSAQSGEVFARLDHIPSGWFVKGMVGGGVVTDGHIDDRDFLVTQFKFSDTTSDVRNGNLSFAMFDVGWAYSPAAGLRLGFFAGYHYWREKVTANGIVCNMPRSSAVRRECSADRL